MLDPAALGLSHVFCGESNVSAFATFVIGWHERGARAYISPICATLRQIFFKSSFYVQGSHG